MDRPRLVSTRSILTDRQLLVITLRHRDGLKWGEVAIAMQCAEVTVKQLHQRALERLEKHGKPGLVIDFL